MFEDSGSTLQAYARIRVNLVDDALGASDGQMLIQTRVAGSAVAAFNINSAGDNMTGALNMTNNNITGIGTLRFTRGGSFDNAIAGIIRANGNVLISQGLNVTNLAFFSGDVNITGVLTAKYVYNHSVEALRLGNKTYVRLDTQNQTVLSYLNITGVPDNSSYDLSQIANTNNLDIGNFNFTLGDIITFASGGIIDNIIEGLINIRTNATIEGNLTVLKNATFDIKA